MTPIRLTSALALACLLAATPTLAATDTMQVEGALLGAGGTPAVDGDYDMSFALYKDKGVKTPSWSEGPLKVKVGGGRFTTALGTSKPLDAKVIAELPALWLGVQVGADPQLPQQRVHAAPLALVATVAQGLACSDCIGADALANGSVAAAKVGFNFAGAATKGGPALDLACTGCVGVAELSFDGDVDLGGNSLKAKNAAFSGDLVAKTVTATALVGDGSKITGVAMPTGACKAGEAIVAIAADGSVKCGPAGASLPADGLDEVSNGLLHNQFVDKVAAAAKGVKIPDNTGADASSGVTFPDLGVAQAITISVHVQNTDPSALRLRLLTPNDKKVGLLICDPCGKDDTVKELKLTIPTTPLQQGDLAALVGTNIAGTWTLVATDTSFCLPQKPGNEPLCDTTAKTDGTIVDWSIEIKTLSSQKVATKAGSSLVAGGVIQLADLDPAKVPCDAGRFGAMFASSQKGAFYVCNGKEWRAFALTVQGTQTNPGLSCRKILETSPLASDGVYWLDPDGGGPIAPFQALCDMSGDGGGWTLVWSNLRGGSGKFETNMKWTTATTTAPLVKGTLGSDREKFQVYTGLNHWVALLNVGDGELRYSWASDFGSPIDQAMQCKASLDPSASYTLTLSACKQLVGGVAMGLLTYHNGKPFRTVDNDATTCAPQYTNTPWWYVACWDGSLNGGGEGSGGGYANGAYWVNSAKQWGADNGQGGGNGWMWVR